MNIKKKGKQLFAVLLSIAMIITTMPLGVVTANAVTAQFAGGSGTEADPYLIETKEHLNNVRNDLDAHYKMIADIVFTDADFSESGSFYNEGQGWMPIGTSTTNSFTGSFNGNNKTIKGLHINVTTSGLVYAGLFGCCNGGDITNLTVDSGSIEITGATKVYAGGICAYSASTNFYNCYNSNNLEIIVHAQSTGVEPYSYVGGVSGYGGNCTNCENKGNIITEVKVYNDDYDFAYCGGIVGGYAGTISNCTNYGNISAASTSTWTVACVDAGGIAGSTSKMISNCKNYGNISCSANNMTSVYAGGICGSFSGETLEMSYNAGTITGPHAAGIAGGLYHSTISNCYNLGEITSSDYAGGIAGYVTYNGEISSCYNVGIMNGSDNSVRIGGITGYMSSGISGDCYFLDNVSSGTGRGTATTTKCSNEEMCQSQTYTNFNFENTWEFVEGNYYKYPTLKDVDGFVINETATFNAGSGTQASPYCIASPKQLYNVRSYLGSHFKLVRDIIFTETDFAEGGTFYNGGAGWTPIGDQSSWSFVDTNDGFTGTFDGNGYNIVGLIINVNSDKLDYAGLFACNNGTISNLTLRDSAINITSSNHVYAGSITGLNYAGVISNSRAVDCTVKTKSTGASSTAGGIVGFARSESEILACYSTSNVCGESNAYAYAGGIIGAGGGNISNCYNTGYVNAKYVGTSSFTTPGAGGIVGSAQSTTITNCYNVGYVSAYTSTGSSNVGGICGTATTPAISNCFYLGNIKVGTGSGDNGTTKCTVSTMKNKVTFEEYNFDSLWTMEGNIEYPYPELINMSHIGRVQSTEVKDWSDYTPISTKEELNAIRDNLSGKYYLVTDIVFCEDDFKEGGAFYNEGTGWLPIGTDSSTVFTGVLDGNGHKISGLSINRSDESIIYIGLFGYSNGTIKDLLLTDCEIFATADTATLDVGGIVGYNYRNGLVTHCSFDGTINAQDYSGGLVGANWGTIEECYNNGNITSTDYAGGIAGFNYETISNCYNSGIIACSSYLYAGGIVGTNSGTIDLCYNIGNVKSTNYKGGICGKNSDIVSSCYYLDTMSLGSGYGADTATKCGVSDLQLQQTFAEFDFDFVWTIDSNSKYPFPTLKNIKHETSGDNTTDFAGGTGDVWNPYIITTTTHLNNVRNDLNAYYVLGGNVAFTESDFAEGGAFYNGGNGWQPIGTYTTPFAGSFDGKGYSINGLKVTSGVEGDTYIGLFGCVDGSATSTIKNVNAMNFSINILGDSISTSSSYSDVYVGTIVGYGSAKNCTASGEVSFTYTSNTRKCLVYLGGVVGYGSATNCTNSCDLSADIAAGSAHVSLYIGGIAGRGQNISLCSNYGTLYAYSKRNYNSYIEIGGIAGYAVNVSQSGNSGGITGGGYSNVNHIYVGGIIGRGVDTTTIVEQCYNVAVLKGERGEYTGGIVGYLGNNSRVANSFNAGAVTNGASGGIAGYSSSGTRISNCYNIGYVEEGYGIVYNKYSDATFENCYCLEGVSKNRDYVIVCTEQEMITKDVYRGFDFNTIWQIGNNSRYPWPELQTGSVQNNMIDISDCVVSLVPTKVSYHDVQPEFTVSYNGEVLSINEDYIAFFIVGDKSWRVQTTTKQYIHDVGIGKLLVIGSGDFCYTTTYEFNIEKYDMANASLWTNWVSDGTGGASSSRFSIEDFIYDGTAKVQSGFRVCDTYDTIEDGCFEITYVNNIEPGTATMIIKGVGDYYTGEFKQQFTIYDPTLESISITKKPNKLIYNEGDSFDKSGMVVTAYYNNGTNTQVTDYTVSGYSSTAGTKTITISYKGKIASFTVTVNSRVPSSITSSKHTISGGNISKITAGTTVFSLLSGLNEGDYCKVYKGNSVVGGNTAVGTGMVIKIMDGNTVKAAYNIIVTGDTNGDGNITVTDMIAIKAHVLKKSTLSGVYAIAADTNGDGGISITDFIQVKAKILGKGSITAR